MIQFLSVLVQFSLLYLIFSLFYSPHSVPPTSLTNGNTNYDVTLNNPISLPCEVDSYPPPTITWLKDGKVIPFSNSHYIILPTSMDIPRAVVRDSGIYTCIASNIVGNVSRSYSINVQGWY